MSPIVDTQYTDTLRRTMPGSPDESISRKLCESMVSARNTPSKEPVKHTHDSGPPSSFGVLFRKEPLSHRRTPLPTQLTMIVVG
jgi:hypothetical protein